MADDNGGGFSQTLGRKIGPLPAYAWLVGAGFVGLLLFRILGAKKAAASSDGTSTGAGDTFSSGQTTTTTDPTTGDTTTSTYNSQGNGYLPGQLTWGAGQMPYSQGDVYVNLPAQNSTTPPASNSTTPVDVYNAAGQDLGQYRYGGDQVNYLNSNLGKYGITQQIIDDVQKTYQNLIKSVGQQNAQYYHFSWVGPGNVQAVPAYTLSGTNLVGGTPQSSTSPVPQPVSGT